MKCFVLNRRVDDSGVSGTGTVAEGAKMENGKVILAWLTDTPSLEVFDSVDHLLKIHGHGNHTLLEWL